MEEANDGVKVIEVREIEQGGERLWFAYHLVDPIGATGRTPQEALRLLAEKLDQKE